ncbi:hypothetical protein MKX03_032328 [Papaver bracteatum]|nr:hypothetical protein MKX03_032328 [Papaver bracteatum]
MKSFESELNALTETRHRNIVKLFGFCSNPERRISFLVYEFIERGIITLLSDLLLPSSSLIPTETNQKLKDILEQRIGAPGNDVQKEIMYITKVGISCLRGDPSTRPTMQEVSVELSFSAKSRPSLAKPFETITLADLLIV